MRYLMLTIIVLSFPLFYSLLSGQPRRRPAAFAAIGTMLFLSGSVRVDAFLYGWPLWEGTVKGFAISPIDTLALALLTTGGRKITRIPFITLMILLGLLSLLSVFQAKVPVAALFWCWQFLRVILLFITVALEASKLQIARGIFVGFAVGLVVQAIFVLYQKASGVIQAPGTMAHQNILGMATEAALIPLLAAMLAGERRFLIKVGVVAALAVITLGGSRATLGLAGAGVLTLLILSAIRAFTPTKAKVLGLVALAGVLSAPLAYTTLHKRFGSGSVITDESVRDDLENVAKSMAADHPFGIGINQFVLVSNTQGYADRAGVNWAAGNRARPTHNAYLLSRAELGYLGEVVLVLLLLYPFCRGIYFAFSNRAGSGGEIVLGSAIAALLTALHNNFEFAFFTYNINALYIVNIGVIAAHLRVPASTGFRRVNGRLGPSLLQERA